MNKLNHCNYLIFFINILKYKKGITIHAIRTNVRIPDGICACYPALHLDLNRFTPSYLIGNIFIY